MMVASEMSILLSLPALPRTNPYQDMLAQRATALAKKARVNLEVHWAENNAAKQREYISSLVSPKHIGAVLCMPADERAMASKIGESLRSQVPFWMLNRIPDYLNELWEKFPETPLAVVTPDQLAVGALQAEQAVKLLDGDGTLMYVTGPSTNWSANQRALGFDKQMRPYLKSNIKMEKGIRMDTVNGWWNSDRAYQELVTWKKALDEHYKTNTAMLLARMPNLIVLQSEGMYEGVRKAFAEFAEKHQRPDLAKTPMIGCDGTPEFKALVDRGDGYYATIELPSPIDIAMEAAIDWLGNEKPPQRQTILPPASYPAPDRLRVITKQAA